MRLSKFGYKESKNVNIRRNALLEAARKFDPERVMKALRSRKYRKTGYKEKRLNADINYMKKKTMHIGSLFL